MGGHMSIVTCPNCGAKNRIDEGRAVHARPKCGRCGTPLGASSEPLIVSDATFARDVLGVAGKPVLRVATCGRRISLLRSRGVCR